MKISICILATTLACAAACPFAEKRRLSGDVPSVEAPQHDAPNGLESAHGRNLQAAYAPKSCTKRTFKTVEEVFGDQATALKCFNNAVSTFKAANWNDFAGPALRAAFHDAGTWSATANSAFDHPPQCGGANGSFKNEFSDGNKDGFKSFPQQNGMKSVYNLLWDSAGPKLADKIRASVPYTSDTSPGCKNFSDADLIQILGYVAVVKTGGTATGGCMFRPGRTDDAGCDDTTKLPSEAHNDQELLVDFGGYDFNDALAGIGGLSLGDGIATLSGAHTIGKSRAHDKSPTSMGFGSLSGTPDKFDGEYYQEVDAKDGYSGNRGWFASDRHGRCVRFKPNDKPSDFSKTICDDSVSSFAFLYHKYAQGFLNKDDTLFKNNFCNAYQAMGTIGYSYSKDDYLNVAKNFIIA